MWSKTFITDPRDFFSYYSEFMVVTGTGSPFMKQDKENVTSVARQVTAVGGAVPWDRSYLNGNLECPSRG